MPVSLDNEKYKKTLGGWFVLTFEEKTNSLDSWSTNIASRFESLSPDGNCSISNYRIEKVLNSNDNLVPQS